MRAVVLLLPLLAGCVSDLTGYPSLAVRPEERLSGMATVEDRSTGSPAAGTALAATLARLRREAGVAGRSFDGRAGTMERDVARASGAAVDSEAWTFAQQAVSRAEADLVSSAAVVAEVDELLAELRLEAASEPGTAGLDEVIAARQAIASSHQERVDRVDAARARLR